MSNERSRESLDLSPAHLSAVRRILRQHVPDREVRAFGSRAGGRPKPFSDLDLLVLNREPIEPLRWALLHEAFSESDLPFKVDLVDWSTADASFRERLLKSSVLVQSAAAG